MNIRIPINHANVTKAGRKIKSKAITHVSELLFHSLASRILRLSD